MFMHSILVSAALLLTGFCLAASAQTKPNEDDTIRVETRLVNVPVVVSDRNGRYVSNLTQKDFTVFQDGRPMPIDFFAATDEPISVALLIDTSQSTRPVLDDIKDSARAFIKLLNPKDRAMIVSFDYQINVLSPLTSDESQLKRAVDQAEIPPRGETGTLLRDAVYEAVTRTFAGIKGRKAIILLTDGKDSGSSTPTDALFYKLQESDMLIYPVMFSTGPTQFGRRNADRMARIFGPDGQFRGPNMPNPRQQQRIEQALHRMGRQNEIAREVLIEMSDATAGRFFTSEDGRLKKTFESIVDELRHQYHLGFYPADEKESGVTHELKVKVARTDVAVRSRSSYRTERK